MAKKFNITGTCVPGLHYMADISAKLKATLALVEDNQYFIINRPRQYGKTTMLLHLSRALKQSGDYLPFSISFEGVGDEVFQRETAFCAMFLQLLKVRAEQAGEAEIVTLLEQEIPGVTELSLLSRFITDLARTAAPRKLVLLIDEVDKSSNNQLFVSFLGMLRTKYLDQLSGNDQTFHSIVLAGVHDIKTLKLKLRPGEEAKYNSPWNIASDYDVDMNLQPAEIAPMLDDYCRERGVRMDIPAIAGRLFFYTSGYPFLVSKICKMLDESLLPGAGEWTAHDVDKAASRLVNETNTNFDSLIKNLENNEKLYLLVYRIVIEAEQIPFIPSDPTISLGALYGIFKDENGVAIHNKIYAEYITAYMTSKMLTEGESRDLLQYPGAYTGPDRSLDMEKLLSRFQGFMKAEYNKKDRDFLERQGRLLFLAFLKPILNGHGYSFKEPQISEERRLDVVITFYQHRYVAELKVWRGEAAHQAGLRQLAGYLAAQELDRGYLVVFDHGSVKSWKHEQIELDKKQIFAVWV